MMVVRREMRSLVIAVMMMMVVMVMKMRALRSDSLSAIAAPIPFPSPLEFLSSLYLSLLPPSLLLAILSLALTNSAVCS